MRSCSALLRGWESAGPRSSIVVMAVAFHLRCRLFAERRRRRALRGFPPV